MMITQTLQNLDEVDAFLNKVNATKEKCVSEVKIEYTKSNRKEIITTVFFTDNIVENIITYFLIDDIRSEIEDIALPDKLILIFRVYPEKSFIRIESDNNIIKKITTKRTPDRLYFANIIQYSCINSEDMRWFLNLTLSPNNSKYMPCLIKKHVINFVTIITVYFVDKEDKPIIIDVEDVFIQLNSTDNDITITYEVSN